MKAVRCKEAMHGPFYVNIKIKTAVVVYFGKIWIQRAAPRYARIINCSLMLRVAWASLPRTHACGAYASRHGMVVGGRISNVSIFATALVSSYYAYILTCYIIFIRYSDDEGRRGCGHIRYTAALTMVLLASIKAVFISSESPPNEGWRALA
jgi:hypothetical protein